MISKLLNIKIIKKSFFSFLTFIFSIIYLIFDFILQEIPNPCLFNMFNENFNYFIDDFLINI